MHVGLLSFEDLIPTSVKTSAPTSRKQSGESIPSVEKDGHKLRWWFPPPAAPAAPHVTPPFDLWPQVVRRFDVPADVEQWLLSPLTAERP